jgi:aryl-phospho-beta-D-glucosidase BglC (GH1 family)
MTSSVGRTQGQSALRKCSLKIARLLLIATMAASAALGAAGGPASAEPTIAPRLARGINLAHWFAQSNHGYGKDHLQGYVTNDEMQRLAKVGFTHVRLSVELGRATGTDPSSVEYQTIMLDKIEALIRAGLAVVVDLHPTNAEKQQLVNAPNIQLVGAWIRLARMLKRFPPEILAVEVMNEPHPMQGRRWHMLQASVVKGIRSVLPKHTIIANPGGWSSISDFTGFQALRDRNIIYTAHVYDPHLFTHQGATWAWDIAKGIKGLPWPIDTQAAEEQARATAAEGKPFQTLKDQIAKGMMQADWFNSHLDKLVAWQKRNRGASIWVGEFGVYRKFAPREARLAWHAAAQKGFAARGWGWALWDYTGDFGIVQPGKGRAYDGQLLQALGMKR